MSVTSWQAKCCRGKYLSGKKTIQEFKVAEYTQEKIHKRKCLKFLNQSGRAAMNMWVTGVSMNSAICNKHIFNLQHLK